MCQILLASSKAEKNRWRKPQNGSRVRKNVLFTFGERKLRSKAILPTATKVSVTRLI